MLGVNKPRAKSARDEAEKPFWISYADLMTALMVLFLVTMCVVLVSINQQVISGPEAHAKKVDDCMLDISQMTQADFPGVTVQGHTISFGSQAVFATNQHRLDNAAQDTLRRYVPKVLNLARASTCEAVFKRVIVEGFASQSGTYIHNLNLSLQRAQRVLCVLLDPKVARPLSEGDRISVRDLFLVGGSSFNGLKANDAESQRIELKLEFLAYKEVREKPREAKLEEDLQYPLDR